MRAADRRTDTATILEVRSKKVNGDEMIGALHLIVFRMNNQSISQRFCPARFYTIFRITKHQSASLSLRKNTDFSLSTFLKL